MARLPTPDVGQGAAERFVAEHLGHLVCDTPTGSVSIRGGQTAADSALAGFDVSGYARSRNEVYPADRRGASKLSPYIRHGLLTLPDVWSHVAGGPARDVSKFRDELLWQEYSRHWYARLGSRTQRGVRQELGPATHHNGWDSQMLCIATVVGELESDGWLVNQTRMWLSSHWSVRNGSYWRDGEDYFFRQLLDGSRAANRLGWQWTSGVGSNKPYGFSRFQVNKRAPGLCDGCPLNTNCPIEDWPDDPPHRPIDQSPLLKADADLPTTTGPTEVVSTGEPTHVWLTAESLGLNDPALDANPDLPAVFVFDEPLLAGLDLSAKRLVFLVETLAELGESRTVELALGVPAAALADYQVAVTFAPVPGFRSRAAEVRPVEVHRWPWLAEPHAKSIASFSAWRKALALPEGEGLGSAHE